MKNATTNQLYDFKTRDLSKNTTDLKEKIQHHTPFVDRKIASVRDICNYGAGYMAVISGFSWSSTRAAFDTLQTKQEHRIWKVLTWRSW